MRSRCALSWILILCSAASLAARASDWPHWRGPQRNGISSETGWVSTWPDDPPIAWRAEVGLGLSSVVVSSNRLCTVGHVEDNDVIHCFEADTGKQLWTHAYRADLGDKYFQGGTTGSPTWEGGRVYWISRWGDVFCLKGDDGQVVWKRNLREDFAARVPTWGFSGAPLVHGDLLLLNVGDAGVALRKDTGRTVWQSENKDSGYSTPLPVRFGSDNNPGPWLALIASRQSYVAVRIADGKEVWRIRWLTQYDVNAADPVVLGNQVFISTGYGKGGALYDVGSGEPRELWKSKALRTQMNTAVLYEGHLYGVDGDTTEKASLKCLEFSSGKEKWSQPDFGSGGVTIADGRLIALNGSGELLIGPASPTGFETTTRAQIVGGQCWTAPVLAKGIIYCRNTDGALAAVNVRKSK